MTFTYDTETKNIAVATGAPIDSPAVHEFSSAAQLGAVLADVDLVDVWNTFAGAPPFGALKPVKKFTSRKLGIARIWKAIQLLAGGEAKSGPANKAAKPAKTARQSRPAGKAKVVAAPAREGSQKATVVAMIARKGGATLPELMKATGWQKHSIRGLISTLQSKGGMNIESSKNAAGERVYEGR